MATKNKKRATTSSIQSGQLIDTQKTSVWDKAAFFFSIIACISSIWFSFKLSDYERNQSLVPNVCFLNQTLHIPFSISSESDRFDSQGTLDFSSFDPSFYPLGIPIRNIGTGLAQNVFIEFTPENQIQTLEQCRTRLEECGLYPEVWTNETFPKYKTYMYLKEYEFKYKENKLSYIDYWGCPNHIEHYNYLDEPSQSGFPYVLPLHQENNPNYVVLPEYLSAFILETIHQEMLSNVDKSFDPITLTGKLSYQDINGKKVERNFELKFNMFPNSRILFYAPELFLQIESEQLQTN